ncbi:MAG TPA: chitobiase/beta-hexosaminidase C-terminal domain-containing protein [Opitutaceae bacterium]|nr:chitobiase/beta-hexosaminidase C-terminal domain-containing protein [Opitutaceae bacterium]
MHPPLHIAIRPFASSGPTGYTPQQLRHAYGFDQLGATGSGQIIAIVDAYGSPTIQSDLDTFCAAFGIASTTVLVYNPQGQPPVNSGWGSETSLDVEWAHAIAPYATIVVVDAKSSSTSDLLGAVDFAVSLGAKQVSMSWGGSEFSTESSSDYHFNVPGVAFFASSGDNGAGVEYPAASPYVVGVGGTTLHLTSSNTISSETAWSGSGGGTSAYESIPGFQSGWLSSSKRGVPDVAYDADPATGVPVYQTGAGWQQFGGTSMSAPQWAALCALANSLRSSSISSAPSAIYSLANANYTGYFRDITSGSNGHSAGSRYDLVTGLGSPLGAQLILALSGSSQTVAAPQFNPPSGTYASTQTVVIADATSGAFIRYTTDGSTPTATNGTIYSAPVLINTPTTLKAVAYTGTVTSPVTIGLYTITTGGTPTLNFEAESLSYTGSGATTSVQTDKNSSGGKWVELAGNSVGDHIDFTVPNVPAGTYQLKMEWKGNNTRGILQLSVDGANLGPTLDQYASGQTYPTTTFGNVTFASAGNHTVRLTVTGKNSKSSSYQLSADKFTFVGQ